MTPHSNRDEEIFNAYAAGMAEEHITQRYGISENEVRTVVARELGLSGGQSTGPANARPARSALIAAVDVARSSSQNVSRPGRSTNVRDDDGRGSRALRGPRPGSSGYVRVRTRG